MAANQKFRIFIYYPIVLSLVLCGGILLGHMMHYGQPHQNLILNLNEGGENGRKIGNLLDYINEEYVDTVNLDDLTETAIHDLIQQLDPHSAYIPASDLETVNEPLEGKFDGIGVEFNIIKDTIVVLGVIPGGPSEKLGIRSGDRIVTIEEDTVAGVGFKNKDVIAKLRGERGTIVNVGVFRKGESDSIGLYRIKRDKIPIYSVDAGIMLDNEIGYIRISRFAATTMDEFEGHLESLANDGMKGLILDLRGNSGGYLQAAIALADEFLPNKDLIVYTKRRDGRKNTHYATRAGNWENQPLVVLINEGSASASEIMAGAVQDHDRGQVIGRRSFGKGLVQEQVILPDGAGVRLTVARYYTPVGRCIQRPYDDLAEYEMDTYHRYETGELYSRDSIKVDEDQKFVTEAGKTVYGGGGIIPDVFVALDTSTSYRFYNEVLGKGIVREYALTLSDKFRKGHENPDLSTFIKAFTVEKAERDALISMAKESGIAIPTDPNSFDVVETELIARTARNLFNGTGYFSIRSQDDEMVGYSQRNLAERDFC